MRDRLGPNVNVRGEGKVRGDRSRGSIVRVNGPSRDGLPVGAIFSGAIAPDHFRGEKIETVRWIVSVRVAGVEVFRSDSAHATESQRARFVKVRWRRRRPVSRTGARVIDTRTR